MILLTVSLAYVLGSIPFGVIVGRWYGADPLLSGSGRIGASNAYRATGSKRAKWLTLIGDLLKGMGAVAFAGALTHNPWAVALAALAAIVGHNYSCFLGLRGGAGSTPNVGALLVIHPPTGLVIGILGLVLWSKIKIASIASLIVLILILADVVLLVLRGTLATPYLLYGVGQAVLITWSLRPNFKALREGRERRVEPLPPTATE